VLVVVGDAGAVVAVVEVLVESGSAGAVVVVVESSVVVVVVVGSVVVVVVVSRVVEVVSVPGSSARAGLAETQTIATQKVVRVRARRTRLISTGSPEGVRTACLESTSGRTGRSSPNRMFQNDDDSGVGIIGP
jgi:hypothetical protein